MPTQPERPIRKPEVILLKDLVDPEALARVLGHWPAIRFSVDPGKPVSRPVSAAWLRGGAGPAF